jgi:hypothetical protein
LKRAKHIYAAICDFENLYAAWRQARRGKRYQPSIARRLEALPAVWVNLQIGAVHVG